MINAVNAARASYGLQCVKIVALDPPVLLTARYTSSGTAAGCVEGFDRLLAALDREGGGFDAVALTGVVHVPDSYRTDYFRSGGELANPWGGVEAIYTHALSLLRRVPSAHAPMLPSKEIAAIAPGVVDPRMAAEVVSSTYLQCILKGLQRSPRILPVTRRPAPAGRPDRRQRLLPRGPGGRAGAAGPGRIGTGHHGNRGAGEPQHNAK